jgi:hypothetical protein
MIARVEAKRAGDRESCPARKGLLISCLYLAPESSARRLRPHALMGSACSRQKLSRRTDGLAAPPSSTAQNPHDVHGEGEHIMANNGIIMHVADEVVEDRDVEKRWKRSRQMSAPRRACRHITAVCENNDTGKRPRRTEKEREKLGVRAGPMRESVVSSRKPHASRRNSIDACPKKKNLCGTRHRAEDPRLLSFFPSFSPSVITFANRCNCTRRQSCPTTSLDSERARAKEAAGGEMRNARAGPKEDHGPEDSACVSW